MDFEDIKQVAPWGRSFDEYVRIFELAPEDLSLRILNCGGGPASFAAEAAERGLSVVACDPIYRFRPADIERCSRGLSSPTVLCRAKRTTASG